MGTGRHVYGKGRGALGSPATMGPHPKYSSREADCKCTGKAFPGLVKQENVASKCKIGENKKKPHLWLRGPVF